MMFVTLVLLSIAGLAAHTVSQKAYRVSPAYKAWVDARVPRVFQGLFK